MLDQIVHYNNVLTQKQFEEVEGHITSRKWGFQYSEDNSINKPLWILDNLETIDFFNTDILTTIEQLTKMKFSLDRCYVNGQTSFIDGTEHYDDYRENSFTFLIYMNRQWKYEWGGETVCFDRFYDPETNMQILKSTDYRLYMPIPNSAIFFPGKMYHYGRGPGRDFYGIRFTLAFKLLQKI